MKKRALIVIGVLLATVFLVPAVLWAQEAREATNTQIRQNCQLAQTHLRTVLRPHDLRARVDRLQVYQYAFRRLDIFVQRLERHQQPHAAELRQAAVKLQQQTDRFKRNYESYDTAREQLALLGDCSGNVHEFKRRLAAAREMLTAVQADIKAIDSTLQSDILEQLEQSLNEARAGEDA